MDDDQNDVLPPLPKPLVPTHSRSFSSSSSSSPAASEADEPSPAAHSPFALPSEWVGASSTMVRNGQRRSLYDAHGNAPAGLARTDSTTLNGTSPPLGMNFLADEQPFADSFAKTARRRRDSSGAESLEVQTQEDGELTLQPSDTRRQHHSESAISAADADFPRSSTSPSPSPAPSRSSTSTSTAEAPYQTPTAASSSSQHSSFLSRVSPNLSANTHSRFASTSAVGLRASPSPSAHSRRSPSLPSSPPSQPNPPTLDQLGQRLSQPTSARGAPLETSELPASASIASDLGSAATVRRRTPFASTTRSADEDPIVGNDGAGAGSAAPTMDESLLRRRKYRARVSSTPSTHAGGDSTAINTRVGGSADLSARSRQILDEINDRARGDGVASSSAVQDPALRRTATVETLRGTRQGVVESAVDEFGIVSRVGGAVPRSRTMGDLVDQDAAASERSRDAGSNLSRSASSTSRTYGYRSGSRASQVLAAVRPNTTLSQYGSPPPVGGASPSPSSYRSRIRSSDLGDLPPPLPTSTSAYRLRTERERPSTALGSVEDRDRDRVRTTSGSTTSSASRAASSVTRRLPLPSEYTSRQARTRALEQQSPSVGRAATSLGTASLGRHRRPHMSADTSFYSSDDDEDQSDRRSLARTEISLGTPGRTRRGGRTSAADGIARRYGSRSEDVGGGGVGGGEGLLRLGDAEDGELERTPRSGKKTSAGATTIPSGGGGVRRALYPDSYGGQTTPHSNETASRSGGTRSNRRERSTTGSEIGSEAWLAEIDRMRRRTNLSRMSGGSSGGDAASVMPTRTQADVDRERTVRAINNLLREQGIVAAVASDSLSVASPASSNSSPWKRESFNGFEHQSDLPPTNARLAFGRDSPAALPTSRSLHRDLSRIPSSLSVAPPRAETALRGLIDRAGPGAAEHHKLLFAALDQFDKHFTEAAQRETAVASLTSPSSGVALSPALDLVKRMDGLVSSTTRLNSGLRGLVEAVKADQVQAELADEDGPGRSTLSHFERSVNALLKTSEDQVRSLTEDLVAIVRLDRDRVQGANGSTLNDTRPTSRASTYRSSLTGSATRGISSVQSPPRRAATASPYEGSTVSHASARSPTAVRQTLRDPLLEQTPSPASSTQSAFSRHTVGYSGGTSTSRSPLAQVGATPSPANRRESVHARSPLADGPAAYETPSRTTSLRRRSAANSIAASASFSSRNGLAGLGLPLPSQGASPESHRRSRTSVSSESPPSSRMHVLIRIFRLQDGTVRPPSPTQTRVAEAAYPVTSIDSTQATTQTSPTHPPASFHGPSEHDRELPDLPEASPVVGLQRFPTVTEGLRPVASKSSLMSVPTESPTSARKRSLRLSGGLGAAIKNAFTGGGNRKSASEGPTAFSPTKPVPPPPVPPLPASAPMAPLERTSSIASTASVRTGADRAERRREVEGILRRAGRS
ncbi:hypothetical protein JCM10908_000142 [Rhodotorula pacifica]|uniref:uncharacterized protein n=1 Tax=Rhodotorula pacifica TaxID=1495444 RepID=UPI00317CBC6B